MYLAALAFLLFGSSMAFFNWTCVIASYRCRRAGIQRHISTVPIAGLIFACLAALFSLRATPPPIPGWLLVVVALADPATLSILYTPVFLLRRKLARR